MKAIPTFFVLSLLGIFIASSLAPANAAPPNRMTGQDWGTRGYNNQAAKQKQMKNTKTMNQQQKK